ncbi:MAG TPA: GAF domain-containing protein [Verrucomicrobiae bacterium]|nr:GAF domain-containing protein [Verrucomicrobiae bacterium]
MSAYALIADFDPGRSARYADLLRTRGLDAVLARDGLEAIGALKSRGVPAIIVTDLSLPGADGFAVLREARKLSPGKQPPAVVVSAFRELRAAAETLKSHLAIQAILPHSLSDDLVGATLGAVLAGQTTAEIPAEEIRKALAAIEATRLAHLDAMQIVDDLPPDEALQGLARKTAEAFHVPVALVSLILDDRQWFKAYYGLEGEALAARGTPKEWAFCRHVVQGKEPLVVPDAASHPYFSSNPLVKAGVIGSYAGAPLVTPGGDVLGTLCIIDSKPLAISASEVEVLALLARRVAGELEMRSKAWRKEISHAPDDVRTVLGYIDSAVLLVGAGGAVLFASPAFDDLFERPLSLEPGATREAFMAKLAPFFEAPDDFLRRVRVDPHGPYSGRETFEMRSPRAKRIRWTARPIPRDTGFAQLETFTEIDAAG